MCDNRLIMIYKKELSFLIFQLFHNLTDLLSWMISSKYFLIFTVWPFHDFLKRTFIFPLFDHSMISSKEISHFLSLTISWFPALPSPSRWSSPSLLPLQKGHCCNQSQYHHNHLQLLQPCFLVNFKPFVTFFAPFPNGHTTVVSPLNIREGCKKR